jgi:hypothetical protein
MTGTQTKKNISDWLRLFSEQHSERPTRLGVFVREGDGLQDYWIEDGLPLAGIDAEANGAANIEIMLGREDGERHLTHSVKNARAIKIEISVDGQKDGLEITDADGKITILRFEN